MNQMKPDTGFGMAWVPLNLLGIGISAWMMYIPGQYAHFCPTGSCNVIAAFTVLVTGTVFFCIFSYTLLKWSFYPPGEVLVH